MEKKITVTLSEKATKFFNEVMYSLETPDKNGDLKSCNQSEAINWCLEAMSDFEQNSGSDLITYLQDNYAVYTDTKSRN